MSDIDFKELHRKNPVGTEKLLQDIMDYEPSYLTSLLNLVKRWVLPLGIALAFVMIVVSIIWLCRGAPIWKPF